MNIFKNCLSLNKAVVETSSEVTDLEVGVRASSVDDHSFDEKKGKEDYVVTNIADLVSTSHPAHPQNWPWWKRWLIMIVYCALQIYVIWTSNAYGSISESVQDHFHVSTQVSTLNLSMNILGSGLGPMFLGPLSDINGRKPVYFFSIFLYVIFNISCALPNNITQMVISHFIIGLAGSTALTNVAGGIPDIFSDGKSGMPMSLFVWACAGGSIGAPIGTGVDSNPKFGWRWLYYINIIVGGFFLIVILLIPETLPIKVISRYELAKGRTIESLPKVTTKQLFQNMKFVNTMGFRMIFTEPIVITMGLYNFYAYGISYFFLAAIWPVFSLDYKMSSMGASCTYLAGLVAYSLLFCFQPIQDWIFRRSKKLNHGMAVPEARFTSALFFTLLFPAGMFLFAFTCSPPFHWMVPIVGLAMSSVANSHNWLSILNYLTDCYPIISASSVAAFTLPSYVGAAVFAHVSIIMFDRMATKWAVATMAFISISIPFIIYFFYFFGEKIRVHSALTGTKAIKYLPISD
ncbi:plasma membrane high-affinity import carrier for pyridoxine, pyridoxal, and pyridoxamine Bsu1 [Schizosaccharomyces osmophilus]|uniref:Plasma membrane high-affinity import carrier for pyridoxine, pyridoxal, and pyridoxamine Bsu1 n=1 Tax=Schizosaccharomyces osmophilus TaxID=2545709 RepID=A0AAF0AXF2_9SCHI|nr:plasma membrane high-affinity import carrier for pyridoxine, pyridoxal, and pyridoxamine Bsu1 [Schizosaccharomyces osmophilus]WBW73789.1 plasma membrane high-affinity import carrier for pyridoxine, pyridoxal, and pyridoxamine Bsu1 [Schizosaccharomyces osmophilus]